jgi:hypothetical protein
LIRAERKADVLDVCVRRITSTSAPNVSQTLAISFMNEIFVANIAFAAYLTISALFGLILWRRRR